MKKISSFFLFCIIFFCYNSKAQTVHFKYDENGNRKLRWVEMDKIEKKDSIPTLQYAIDTSELVLQSRIYPNPTSGYLNIEITGEDLNNYQLIIFDSDGRQLKHQEIKSTDVIDLREFETGLYFMLFMSDSKKSLYKIIKQ